MRVSLINLQVYRAHSVYIPALLGVYCSSAFCSLSAHFSVVFADSFRNVVSLFHCCVTLSVVSKPDFQIHILQTGHVVHAHLSFTGEDLNSLVSARFIRSIGHLGCCFECNLAD